uniref:Sorting nexin-17 n=1 Tax=Phallusia mammillata TaxID=59560 RepID=A0A6F9DTX1_9ASCI|nr:sorting nexin-27-like [Phallusia mammillata]
MADGERSRKRDDIYKGPRTVSIEKTDTGFGFNVRGQVSEGGQLKSINGVLYAPLQHVSAILENGSAETAGVRPGDRILKVNGESVEGATHKQVVELIKAGGDSLTMTVISVPARDAQRLDPDDDFFYDYTDVKSINVAVPKFEHVEENGSKFVVYEVTLYGKFAAKRRYSEFLMLYEELMKIFTDFEYPKFPGKWPFGLSAVQLEKRRIMLENFIKETFKIRVIFECDLVQDFLNTDAMDPIHKDPDEPELHAYNADEDLGQDMPTKPKLKQVTEPSPKSHEKFNGIAEKKNYKQAANVLRIFLPNQTTSTLPLDEKVTAGDICEKMCKSLELEERLHPLYSLFIRREKNFYCRLSPDEYPNTYMTLASTNRKRSDFALRKWLFNPRQEQALLGGSNTISLLFGQAVDDIKEGRLTVSSRHASQLKMLASQEKHQDYVELATKSPSYGSVTFPHCSCDSRKRGHVIVNISSTAFKLFACTDDGEIESQVIEFEWPEMQNWEVKKDEDLEESDEKYISFCFQYQRGTKKPRWVKVYSKYADYMNDCFSRVMTEISWEEELRSGNDISEGNIFSADVIPPSTDNQEEEKEESEENP